MAAETGRTTGNPARGIRVLNPVSDPQARTRKSISPRVWAWWGFVAAVCLFLTCFGAGVVMLLRGVNTALEAERRLHSVWVAANAVDAFVTAQNPPRWPRSWDELATVQTDPEYWIVWPRDRDQIEADVIIEFGATLEQVAAMTPQDFEAIRPSGPCPTMWNYDIQHVIETAAKLVHPQ